MDLDASFFSVVFLIFFALTGACLGSFATAIIHREKTGRPWFSLKGDAVRSACPSCRHKLGIADLVPVFSWAARRGKCAHCGAPVSAFYPFVEIVCALGAVLIFLYSGLGVLSLAGLFILPFLVSLFFLGAVYKIFSLRLFLIVILSGFLAFIAQILLLK